MKRTALVTLVLAIAFVVVPAAQAVQIDVGSGTSGAALEEGVVLHTDVLGGNGNALSVPLRADVLGGDGGVHNVTLRPDVLGGDGGTSRATPIASVDSRTWDTALITTMSVLAAMLLAATALATTRRRHRLSF